MKNKIIIITILILLILGGTLYKDKMLSNTKSPSNTHEFIPPNILASSTQLEISKEKQEEFLNKSGILNNTWKWANSEYSNETNLKPNKKGDFSIEFKKDWTVDIKTDCNSMGGKYKLISENEITVSGIESTMMYCEKSKEADFSRDLQNVTSFYIEQNGDLVLSLRYDSGSMIFTK